MATGRHGSERSRGAGFVARRSSEDEHPRTYLRHRHRRPRRPPPSVTGDRPVLRLHRENRPVAHGRHLASVEQHSSALDRHPPARRMDPRAIVCRSCRARCPKRCLTRSAAPSGHFCLPSSWCSPDLQGRRQGAPQNCACGRVDKTCLAADPIGACVHRKRRTVADQGDRSGVRTSLKRTPAESTPTLGGPATLISADLWRGYLRCRITHDEWATEGVRVPSPAHAMLQDIAPTDDSWASWWFRYQPMVSAPVPRPASLSCRRSRSTS